MTKTFIFDAVHTILRPIPDVVSAYYLAGKRYGSSLTKKEVKQRFRLVRRDVFGTSLSAEETASGSLVSSDKIEFQLWRDLVSQVFNDVRPIEELFQSLWEHFASPQNWQLYDDVEPCFREIKDSGDQIVIASNFDSRLIEILEMQPCNSMIDVVFCSAEVGFRKPDPMFYETIVNSLGLGDGDSVIMTGDDYQNDFAAPKLQGWHAVHLNRHGNRQLRDHEIGQLSSILNCC